MVIVDTTVWIDYLGGFKNAQTAWLDREISHQRLGLTDIILCEVLRGVRGEAAFARCEMIYRSFKCSPLAVLIWQWLRLRTTAFCDGGATPFAKRSIA
jgi:predicted nucleic acid-binding protein